MKSKSYQAGYAALSSTPNPYDAARQKKQHDHWALGKKDKQGDLDQIKREGVMTRRLFNETLSDFAKFGR